jgi:heme/copper-type cytochrome/quinol oxidase subunit 2
MKTAALLVALLSILALAIIGASLTWTSIGDAGMSGHGYTALAIGVVVSLVVGCGLMVLVFYSSRRGHDEPPKIGD